MQRIGLSKTDISLVEQIRLYGSVTLPKKQVGFRIKPYLDMKEVGHTGTMVKVSLNDKGLALKGGLVPSYEPTDWKPQPGYEALLSGTRWIGDNNVSE